MKRKQSYSLAHLVQLQEEELSFRPPDGGFNAWVVMLASFVINGVIFGTLNSFGTIFVHLKAELEMLSEDVNDEGHAARASLVGALAIGSTFILSPVAGILGDKFGLRRTAMVGGVIATCGMLMSSFVVTNFALLCVSYGVVFGVGASLCYTPSLSILGHYFDRRMGIVNGVVAAGSSVFTAAMPFALDLLHANLGLVNMLRALSVLNSVMILAATTFKPLRPKPESSSSSVINLDNWRNRKYVVWALAVPAALFGYFVPYVHIVQYVKDILPDYDGNTLVLCLSVTSFVGRLAFGRVADRYPNRVLLQQVSFVAMGVATMALAAGSVLGFEFMVAAVLVLGLFDGCYVAMYGLIAHDLCGEKGAAQGIGFILGLISVPYTFGPTVAGVLRDRLNSYTVAFLLAGCPPLIGAALMTFIYKVPSGKELTEAEEEKKTEEKPIEFLASTKCAYCNPSIKL